VNGGSRLKERDFNKLIELETGSRESADTVKVNLFGRDYSLRGHGDVRHVQDLADFITAKANEIRTSVSKASTQDLVVLTLLNIADELFQHKNATEKTIRKLEEKTDRLLEAIDRVI
jgi:cell division protein ZapA